MEAASDYIVALLEIIFVNIVLSGDNAVVIALACRNLPARERTWGILLGAGAAVVLRIIFTVIIQYLLGIPWLQLIGGILLFWIALKLLVAEEHDDESVASGSSLWEAVKIVAIADIVMSLDNVLAIAAAAMQAPAHQQIWLIIFGLVISIPLVIAAPPPGLMNCFLNGVSHSISDIASENTAAEAMVKH